MKLKIIFFCVLCLITLVLSQYELSYTVDLGTDYAGVMATEQSYSSTGVSTTRYICINILGWLTTIAPIILALYLYIKVGKESIETAFISFVIVLIYSYILVAVNQVVPSHGLPYVMWLIEHFAFISVFFLVAKNFGMTFTKLIIMLVFFFILYVDSQPYHRSGSRIQARQKACYSNMRVMNSAVEMYNMDADKDNMMDELDISKLVSTGYLKAAPTCPETGVSESYVGSNLITTGQVRCLYINKEFPEYVHGYLDLLDPDTEVKPKVYTLKDFFKSLFKG